MGSAQHYSRSQLGTHLIRFWYIMDRAAIVTMQDQQEIEEELFVQYHFDEFIDNNPLVMERVARGKLITLQKTVLRVVSIRFPTLEEQARQQIGRMRNAEDLDQLFEQLLRAPDETSARILLHIPS